MRRFWLFQKTPEGLPGKRRALFWVWNGGVVLLAGLCLGLLSMFFAYGDYPDTIMGTYFHHPLIVVLNLTPVLLLLFLLYGLFGRAWPAFLLADLIVWGLSLGNYYKLRFRDDPVMFQDLKNLRDAAGITVAADYDLTPDKRVWFGILCLLFGTVFLLLLVRGRLPKKPRLALILAAGLLWVPMLKVCADDGIYNHKTENYEQINRWSATQVYLSKGFVYPFLHSVGEGTLKAPEGYRAGEARDLLASYTPEDLPEERKVDLITIQLEAFADFSVFTDVEGVDFDRAYQVYHALEAESYTGNLVTNIFAGGTVDTERAVLTGYADQWNFREDTNSYGWYLGSQGYAVEGSHPSYDWFYNRKNVNRYLGLPVYYYYENRYQALYDQGLAPDSVLMPEIFRLYEENRDGEGKPYFSFNVTYQGHGPYDAETVWWGQHFTDGRYTRETANIVDNYLGSVMDTAECLRELMDRLREEDRPVVLLVFGDHMPWLGSSNACYHELGVDLDTSTKEGFLNYYATRYLLWGNDAARAVLGNELTGEGPDVSSCFLMNLVFDQLGWTGDAWTQAATDIWRQLPVITTVGRYLQADGTLVETPDEAGREALRKYRAVEYYYGSHFQYGE